MEPVRVLHVVPNMHAAGLETLIMNLYRNIDRSKVQFDFLYHYTDKSFYDDEIESLGGHIYKLSFREDGNIFKYIKDLKKFFKEHKYYIVHGHMASTACFYMKYAKKYGVPVRILHSHNTSTEKNIKGFIKHQMLKLSTLYANEFFACGNLAGKFLYKKKKFTIVHNAIDLDKFKNNKKIRNVMRRKYNLDNCFVIGHIGRFNSQKNHAFIIDVFEKFHKSHSNSKLVLVGEGELEDKVKIDVKNRNLTDSVLFLGVVKDTNSIYNMIDVFILPSLFEGLPVVGIEAQAVNCSILISNKVTDEIKITNNVAFLPINEYDSVEKWSNKLQELSRKGSTNKDKSSYTKLTAKGYNILNESSRLLELYSNLLKERGIKL